MIKFHSFQAVRNSVSGLLGGIIFSSVVFSSVIVAGNASADDNLALKKDLTLKKDTVGNSAASLKARQPHAIDVQPGDDVSAAWDAYFAKNEKVHQADVRETVRQLMRRKKFDEIIALIQAAIRNGQPQPWMYQAMGLAMLANNSDKHEIERALMSALEFSSADPFQLTYIAKYMSSVGLDRRALKIYRQVIQLEPTRPEPYVHALTVARRLKDTEGIQWATIGILSQAWPQKNRPLFHEARREAMGLLKRLQADPNTRSEAESFRKQLDEALVRDLIVKVSWHGNADVDMSIVEPSGTTCEIRNPRTTSGGVMLGDSYSRLGKDSDQGYSEYYVCPKAFAGDYQIKLRRVWGKIAAGKVKVEIYWNFRDLDRKKQKYHSEQYTLDEGDTQINFNLEKGSRKEPLAQHKVANAVRRQLAIRHQIKRNVLHQQIAAAADPRVNRLLQASRNDGTGGGQGGNPFANNGFFPAFRGGAVGFQPVITTLPEGANLAATAVISADRRYVRITALPIFSQVGRVLTFNIISGEVNEIPPEDQPIDDGGADGGADGVADLGL